MAEALSLAEISFQAARREISESEPPHSLSLLEAQVQALRSQLKAERERTQALAEELRASEEASLTAARAKYHSSIETLHKQLQVALAAFTSNLLET